MKRSKQQSTWITKYRARMGQGHGGAAPPATRCWWIEMQYAPHCGISACLSNLVLRERDGWTSIVQRLVPCAQYLRRLRPPMRLQRGCSRLEVPPQANTV